jgi:hypothetical protein
LSPGSRGRPVGARSARGCERLERAALVSSRGQRRQSCPVKAEGHDPRSLLASGAFLVHPSVLQGSTRPLSSKAASVRPSRVKTNPEVHLLAAPDRDPARGCRACAPRQSARDCDYARGCQRSGAGRARGEARRGVRSVGAWQQWQRSRFARDRTGAAASERIPANWQFQRTGATGRECSPTDRTQEVAGSSPASSMPICRDFSKGGREAAFALQPMCNPRVHAKCRNRAKGTGLGSCYATASEFRSTYTPGPEGAGISPPSSTIPSRWSAIAARISRSTSSSEAPVATQPGRSGDQAE